jgi:prevent-host-death family protein
VQIKQLYAAAVATVHAMVATMEIGIKDAKNSLSSLVVQARAGKRIFLTNRGERMVELVPVEQQKEAVPDYGLGWLKGKAELPKGFGTARWKKAGTRAVLKDMGLL